MEVDIVLKIGEKIHVVEHRRFESDVRRHFIGTVEECGTQAVRASGFMFVFDQGTGNFLKKEQMRTRIFGLENDISITVLPSQTKINDAEYSRQGVTLFLTDNGALHMDIAAFGSHG